MTIQYGATDTPRALMALSSAPPRTLTRRLGPLVALAVMMCVVGVDSVLVWPYLRGATRSLSHPSWGWVLVASAAQVASMGSFTRVQRRILATGGIRVSMRRMVSLTYAANALSETLPAGVALSSAYTFQRMRVWGASPPLAGFTLLATGALSTVSFGVLTVAAFVLAGGYGNPVLLVAGPLLLLGVGVLVRWVSRHQRPALIRAVERALRYSDTLRRRDVSTGPDRIQALVAKLALIQPRKRDWAAGFAFAVTNWLTDVVCLWACCRALGADHTTISLALLAYVAGMAIVGLSLLPGGLGVTDVAIIAAFTHGGLSVTTATAAVLVYRLLSFVLIVAIGWLLWAAHHYEQHRLATRFQPPRLDPTTSR